MPPLSTPSLPFPFLGADLLSHICLVRKAIWNTLGHCYQEEVDEAILATKDEDEAHLAEIEARPSEIKRARKKAIQLAQKEVSLSFFFFT